MSEEAIEQAKRAIPADIRMFSGCRDEQTSADVANVARFQLPDPAGRAGGACTSAMLQILYAEHQKTSDDKSFLEVLLEMRDILQSGGYTQIPQMSSSHPLDVHAKFALIPDKVVGTKRAVMIGINYVGQPGELSGCHNDVGNMKDYIKNVYGFEEKNITVLMDDGWHIEPTRDNILKAFQTLVDESEPGDAVYCHYSGHGGRLLDDDGDEADGYDETLVPLDYETAGQIRDDDLYMYFAGGLKSGVVATFIMDSCHSGSVLDLPFQIQVDGESDEMTLQDDFDFGPLLGLATQLMADGKLNAVDVQELMVAAGCPLDL